MIRLRTFGLVDLRGSDGSELAAVLAQPKRFALLTYLAAARPSGVQRRDRLLALFWPELDDARARDALNQALRFLRQSLGPDAFIRQSADDVGLDRARLWCDVTGFREAAAAQSWEEALAVYHGDFLRGFFVEEAAGFERWMDEERTALRDLAARGARELARRHEAQGALTLAISWGRRALEFTPDDERALRELLSLYVRAGDHAGAHRLYHDFARRLDAEWGSLPSPETRRLIEELRAAPLEAALRSAPAPSVPPPSGSLAARYRIERELGRGGTATVYLAHDLKHDRAVALKVLHPAITEGLARDRFVREIRIAGQLQHPGIVPLFDSGEADGSLYYVMPVVPGENLRQRMRREPLPLAEVLAVLGEVAETLRYAHERGVIHRDIKPENILLVGPRAVVTDFGIARAAEVARTPHPGGRDGMALTQPGTSLGTPTYMAPEQAAGDPQVSHLADLYALGVVGFEMIAGRPPFVGTTPQQILAAKLTQDPPSLLELKPDTPAWLAGMLMRCLERDPARRPQSAEEVSTELVARRGRSNDTASVMQQVFRRARRVFANRWAAAAIAVAILVAVAFWRASTRGAGSGDPDLVAVLPFRVSGSGSTLAELREGVVDLMAIYLTGEQGGLRAVEPATLFRAWRQRGGGESDLADRDAIALARSVAAAWVLRGSLIGSGGEVLLRANLTPVGGGGTPVHASVTGPADSVLAQVPRLVGRILAQLEGMTADQSGSLTTTSLNAVRAYLAGQSHYRRGEYHLAVDRFTEALGIDSSFALAGLGLLMAHEWAGNASEVAARTATATAWRHRSRLRAKDQALVEAILGPNGPAQSALADVHRARERAAIVAPDRFESWYLLGDHLLHAGALLGIDRPLALAEDAFRRARSLGPEQAGVLEHLVLLAARREDTAELRARWNDLRALVPDQEVQFKDKWLVGHLLHDTTLTREALAQLGSAPAVQHGLGILIFTIPLFPDLLSPFRALVAQAESVTQGRDDRERLARLRWWLALDAGRPEEAGRHVPDLGATISPEELLIAGFFWDAFESASSRAHARLTGTMGICVQGLSHVLESRWDGVRQAVARLSALATPSAPSLPADSARVCASILEAAHAQGTGRPDAARLIDAVDRMLLTVPYVQLTWENLMAARLLEGQGEYRRAAAAATRYRYALGYPSYLSTYLREAGRLAALAGDREGAAGHLTRYLALRRDPEQSRQDEITAVRRLLGSLASGKE